MSRLNIRPHCGTGRLNGRSLSFFNALIASHLSSDTGLGTAELGLLTSVYFLVFAAAQIPVGILLDRFGPRRVQSALLLVAAAGAELFAVSTGFVSLLLARAMIGLGVAAALTAGLKSIVLSYPRERVGGVLCTTCAPRDQEKSHHSQCERAF